MGDCTAGDVAGFETKELVYKPKTSENNLVRNIRSNAATAAICDTVAVLEIAGLAGLIEAEPSICGFGLIISLAWGVLFTAGAVSGAYKILKNNYSVKNTY